MTQVLIDRELLERCRARLYGLMQADLSTELAVLLADHAEQHLEMVEQSVEVVPDGWSVFAMILNALDRDAAEGKAARGEMAAELRALLTSAEGGE